MFLVPSFLSFSLFILMEIKWHIEFTFADQQIEYIDPTGEQSQPI